MIIGLDISVLNDQEKAGIAVYTYGLINALLKINQQDKFVLFGIATFSTFEYLKNLPFKNYPNVEMKIFKMPAKLFRRTFLTWQWFDRPTIENFVGGVNIFHSFNWYLPSQRSGKIVATVFDMTPLLSPKFHQDKTVQLDKVRLNRIKEKADLVIAISENSKKDFLKFSPKSWVEVIYPGVSDHFKIPKDKLKIKKILNKYNLRSGYFLSVGTLEPRKNIENLIKAYLKSGVKEKLVLVGGQGWKNNKILGLIEKYKDKIILTGFVPDEDLPILYNQSLSLVYPSFYEGFGIPVLEAQACGCPVITSNVSSLPEAAGKAALYINPGSTEDIIRALRGIEAVREQLVKKGLENIKRFSWVNSAKKLNFLYQQLLG